MWYEGRMYEYPSVITGENDMATLLLFSNISWLVMLHTQKSPWIMFLSYVSDKNYFWQKSKTLHVLLTHGDTVVPLTLTWACNGVYSKPGCDLNIKTMSYQYRNSHYKAKIIVSPSYFEWKSLYQEKWSASSFIMLNLVCFQTMWGRFLSCFVGRHIQSSAVIKLSTLTHWPLVTPYGDIELCQPRFR